MIIRNATLDDHQQIIELYQELANQGSKQKPASDLASWQRLVEHNGSQVICAETDGHIVAMVTLHILPNCSYAGRPYGLIENVFTLKTYRGQGIASKLIHHASETAWRKDAYKIMLMTNASRDVDEFYRKCGFNSDEKIGMIRRNPT